MKRLTLHKKTGFLNLTPTRPVVIRDFRGIMFYDTTGLRNVKRFNLPEGVYFIDNGNIVPMKHPVKHRLNKVPLRERKLNAPFNFKVYFGNNPNKCTISWTDKTIFFDNKLKFKTLPELYFILFHEYSHSVYGTEKYADLMASNLMKIKGFNPSQIGSAPITSLSKKQKKRKQFITNKIIRVNGRHKTSRKRIRKRKLKI